MHQKMLQLARHKIAYYESNGSGQPVFFVHGNSASGKAYQYQLKSSLGEKYRLIAIDLPGHGDSEPAPDMATYSLPGYAAVIAEAAQALGVGDAVFVGWSLGGHILLEAANLLPKAKGMVIFGTPPLGVASDMATAFLPNPAVNVGFTPNVDEKAATQYAASFMDPANNIDLKPFIDDILRTDGKARGGLGASIGPGGYRNEVEVVGKMTIPLAILHGKAEQLVNLAFIEKLTMPTLWRKAVQVIDGAGHAPHWEQPGRFNELLEAFVKEVCQ